MNYATKIENISGIPVFERFHRLISSICQSILFRHSWFLDPEVTVESLTVFNLSKFFEKNRKIFQVCFDFDRKEDRNNNKRENHATLMRIYWIESSHFSKK